MAGRKEYELLFRLNAELGGGYGATFKSGQTEIANMQKELDDLSKSQSNISAYQKQQQAAESTRIKLDQLKRQYDAIQEEMNSTESSSAALKNKLLQKQIQIEKTTSAIGRQDKKLEELRDEMKKAGVDTANLTEENQRLEGEMNTLRLRQEDAAQSGSNFGSTLMGAFKGIGAAMAAAGITIGLREITQEIQAAVKASVEFESAMAGVAKTSDMSESELARLSKDVKIMSERIPVGTTELLNIAEAAGQLGIEKDNLLEFSEVMANLGVATNLSSMDASTALAKFANVVRMSADDYGRLGSTIVELGTKTTATESEIVEMATRLSSAGELIGLTEAEIMAVATALSSAGIEAEAGGTAMSKLLKEFEVMVETGAPELAEFAKVAGVSSTEFAKKWRENAVNAMSEFLDGLGALDKSGGSVVVVLEKLGITEERMSRATQSLATAKLSLNETLDIANKAWEENTSLAREAEIRYQTTESKAILLKNAYNNLKVTIGDGLNPAYNMLLELGTMVVDDFNELISLQKTMQYEIDVASESFENESANIEITNQVADKYIDRLEELERQGLKTNDAKEEYEATIKRLVALLPELSGLIDKETGKIEGGTEALRKNTEQWYENAKAQAYQKMYTAQLEAFAEKQWAVAQKEVELIEAQVKLDKALEEEKRHPDEFGEFTDAFALTQGPGKYESLRRAAEADVEKREEALAEEKKQLEDATDEMELAAAAMERLTGGTYDLREVLGDLNDISEGSGSDMYGPWLPGYANGTNYAASDLFLAGEEGPELIAGARGSRVFTAAETSSILGGTSIKIENSIIINPEGDIRAQLHENADIVTDMVKETLYKQKRYEERRA